MRGTTFHSNNTVPVQIKSDFECAQQRLRELLASAETDNEIYSFVESEKDHIKKFFHDTKSELEDDLEISEEEFDSNVKFFIGKDGTKLKKDPPAKC